MKRIFSSKNLIVSLVMFNCCCIMLVTNMFRKIELYYEDRGIYSWKTTEINVKSAKTDVLNISELKIMTGDYCIIKNIYENTVDIKGILTDDVDKFHLLEGKFFSANDARCNLKKAVVGEKLVNKLYKKENKSFISTEKQEYEVVGILDDQQDFGLENTVFIPLETSVALYGIKGQYAVDGSVENIKRISNIFKQQNGVVEIIGPKLSIYNSLIDFVHDSNSILYLYLLLLILLIILLAFSVDCCTLKFPEKYQIYGILGIPYKKLFFVLFESYFWVVIISIFIAVAVSELLVQIFVDTNVHVLSVLIVGGFDLLVVSTILIKKIRKEKRGVWK